MTEFQPLDVVDCPLSGLNLIEASAGTGKTWNICGLYLRLLLENQLQVRQILVVTFTRSATAELQDRIRTRILNALDGLHECEAVGQASDPLIDQLLQRLEHSGHSRETLRSRLELARETFDEAAIFTIHGFCQRALGDTPFSAGLPFESEAVQDDAQRLQDAVNDFWRRHISDINPALAVYLLEKKDSPESFARLLKPVLAKPLSTVRWPQSLDPIPVIPDALIIEESWTAARTIWLSDEQVIAQALLEGLEQGRLNRKSYKDTSISKSLDDWKEWLENGRPTQGNHRVEKNRLHLCRSAKLAVGQGTRKGCQPPVHPFFDAAEALLSASEARDAALETARLRLLRELVQSVPAALQASKRQQRVLTFDDMLFNLWQALTGQGGPALTASLRTRYPAALIDEFQDTDPLQFGIFSQLYEGQTGPLFMVGDPKQSIYRFRSADLHTYLMAQQTASHCYTLTENFRSVPGVIDGCNALFGRNQSAFLLPGIQYRAVKCGEKPRQPLTDNSAESRAPFQVWLLPDAVEGEFLLRDEAKNYAARAVAAEIARLLTEGQAGRILLGDAPLTAGAVAVLVRSHREGRLMRAALESQGIGCVELSQSSVFKTAEADELEVLLLAITDRRDARFRAALATSLMGFSATDIEAAAQDEDAYFAHMQRFAGYLDIWQRQGFPVMFRYLLREEGIEARLLKLQRGERRLTNLLHLGELLAREAREQDGVDALLRWYNAQRRDDGGTDVAQLRLESDSHLVQIVTVHKSKGLEYPIVFCPFLWDAHRSPANGPTDLLEYHDDQHQTVLDFTPGIREDERIKTQLRLEDSAETLRLIYVALTRAIHRCYLIAGCYDSRHSSGRSVAASTRSMLNWLVAGNGLAAESWFKNTSGPEPIKSAWLGLPGMAQGGEASISVADFPGLPDLAEQATGTQAQPLQARKAHRTVYEAWNRGSFTGMIRHRSNSVEAADHDADTLPGITGIMELPDSPGFLEDSDILQFPAGASAGSCIHRVFEFLDFTRPDSSAEAIRLALSEFPQKPQKENGQFLSPEPMLSRMVSDVLATPLGKGAEEPLRLSQLVNGEQIREMAFTLSIGQLSAERLNRFLSGHGYQMNPLEFNTIRGFLTGAMDLVFRSGGRFYILDWKSNLLGYAREDYAAAPLAQAMQQHAYTLQYLLYVVALHRYLRARLPDYDYARHFGGVYYLFIRGVRPGWIAADGSPAGVFFDRPDPATIMNLDLLMGQGGAS